jgi:IMP dehydrogenase
MFDVGRSKRAQRAFAFDDITIVPSRRTRGEEEVSLQWRIDAYTFAFPVLAAPMDSVVSPATAIKIGQLGGLGVVNLEGLWTRYDDPQPQLEQIIAIEDPIEATRRMQSSSASGFPKFGKRECRPPARSRRRTPRRTRRPWWIPASTSS